MAKYDVVHKETGETKVIDVSVHDIQQWYQDNPEWVRDWSQGCAGNLGEFGGEWKSKLATTTPVEDSDVKNTLSQSKGPVLMPRSKSNNPKSAPARTVAPSVAWRITPT